MSQNIYQYPNPNWGLKLSLDSYDMSLTFDANDFNKEVVFSPYLIAQTYGNRLPVYFDINNTLTAQDLTLTYKSYNPNNITVCTGCATGYTLNSSNLCAFNCPTNCNACSNNNTCTTCRGETDGGSKLK